MLNILFLPFILLICISLLIYLAVLLLTPQSNGIRLYQFTKKICTKIYKSITKISITIYENYKASTDHKIIYITFLSYCILSYILWSSYYPTAPPKIHPLSLHLQITAIVLALLAAIIAFRNYNRKSGHNLFYTFGTKVNSEGKTYVSNVRIYNEKDKIESIFAIDIISEDKKRIRIINCQNAPIEIAAYSVHNIKLENVHKYKRAEKVYRFSKKHFNKHKITMEFITQNGAVKANLLLINELSREYIKDTYQALRIKNLPEDYQNLVLDIKTKYIINIQEFDFYYNAYSEHLIEAYVHNNKFILTQSSIEYVKYLSVSFSHFLEQNVLSQKIIEENYTDQNISHQDPNIPTHYIRGC